MVGLVVEGLLNLKVGSSVPGVRVEFPPACASLSCTKLAADSVSCANGAFPSSNSVDGAFFLWDSPSYGER